MHCHDKMKKAFVSAIVVINKLINKLVLHTQYKHTAYIWHILMCT